MKRALLVLGFCFMLVVTASLQAGQAACGDTVKNSAPTDAAPLLHPSRAAADDTTQLYSASTLSSAVPSRDSAETPQLSSIALQSQPYPLHQPDSMFWFIKRKPLALGVTLGFSIPIVLLEYQWWWKKDYLYPEHKFLYKNDGGFQNYSLGVDKCGHFFTSYTYFHTFYDLMKWGGYSENTALWTAFAVPAAHAISIELMDGFAKYGFSSYDLTANFLGMGYAYAQIKVPYLRNFNFKWSYYPTAAYQRPDQDWGLSHDYSGHFYWLSVNMKNVLPEGLAEHWPKFLNLAVGYGAQNVSYGDNAGNAKHKFSFSLDYNLSSFDIANDTWAMVVRLVDKFHFPAPGIRYINGEKVQVKPLVFN